MRCGTSRHAVLDQPTCVVVCPWVQGVGLSEEALRELVSEQLAAATRTILQQQVRCARRGSLGRACGAQHHPRGGCLYS